MKNLKTIISKKFLPIMVTILMVISMLPQGLVAFAEGETVEYTFTVSNSDSQAVSGAVIEVEISEGTTVDATTDTNGQAVFSALNIGTYSASITADGYCNKTVEFVASVSEVESNVVLAREITVSGNVIDNENTSVSGLIVAVTDEFAQSVDATVSGSTYSFKAKEGVKYSIEASADNCVTETFDIQAEKTDILNDITLLLKTQKISVTVSGNGNVKVNGNTVSNYVDVTVKSQQAYVNILADSTNGYHIKKVTGAVEYENQGTSNDAINAIIEKSAILTITEGTDYVINAEFEINKYDVKYTSNSNADIELSASEVEHGGSVYATITPKYGYNISSIKVNSTEEVAFSSEDNGTSFKTALVESVSQNTTFSATLEEYAIVDLTNAVAFPTAEKTSNNTRCYSNDVTLNAKSGYSNIVLNKTTKVNLSKVTLSTTTEIKEIAVYNPSSAKWSVTDLNASVFVVIDRVAPVVEIQSIEDKYVNDKIDVTGTVTDEGDAGLQMLVYSDTQLSSDEVKQSTQTVEFDENGSFTVEFTEEQNKNYYFYAIDNSNNISEVKSVRIKVDKTEPVVTNVEFSDEADSIKAKIIKFFTFGIISKDDIYVKVTVKDANNPSSSGLDENNINLEYSSSSTTAKAEQVNAQANDDEPSESSLGGTGMVCTFKLPSEVLANADEFYSLKITAKDNAGNEIAVNPQDDDEIQTNAKNYAVMISLSEPDASITAVTQEKNIETVLDGEEQIDKYWYDGDVEFKVDVFDADQDIDAVHSGIAQVIIKINGQEVENVKYTNKDDVDSQDELISNKSYTVNTSEVPKLEGENVIKVEVYGNNTLSYETEKKVYIDRNNPTVDSVSIVKNPNSLFENVIRFLSFGTFFNHEVEMSFDVSDSKPSSDLKAVYIYKAIEPTEENLIAKDDELELNEVEGRLSKKAKFDLSVRFEENVYVQIEDMVGNKSDVIAINDIDSDDDIEASTVMLETDKPTASVTNSVNKNVSDNHKVGVNQTTFDDEKAYFGTNKEVNVYFKDSDSGLYSASSKLTKYDITDSEDTKQVISKNNKFVDENKAVTESKTTEFDYSDKAYITDGEGKYVVEANVEDNAGNTAVAQSKVFYIDTYSPQITRFEFGRPDYKDEAEDDFTSNVTHQNYGFYFQKETTVTIYANDDFEKDGTQHFASGVNYIDYKLVSKDGVVVDNNRIQCENENSQQGEAYIQIIVPAGFKGQIYAQATDNVGHMGSQVNPYGIVIEETKAIVEFSRPQATETDKNGNDLYNTSVSVDVDVTDNDDESKVSSGISKIEWKITVADELGDYYKAQNRYGYIEIDNKGEVSASRIYDVNDNEITDLEQAERYCKWTLTENSESNLIHNIKGSIFVQNDSNDITLSIRVTDRSGNITDWQTDTFSIDKTAPVINITYDDENKENGKYQQYYNFDRTATITVTERNFDATRVFASLSNVDSDYQYCPSITDINTINPTTGKTSWKENVVKANPNSNTYKYVIKYDCGDGIYDFIITALKDLAGNTFDAEKSIYKDKFIIDKTNAQLSVEYTYADNGVSFGSTPEQYNNHLMRATFTLVDHNADVIVGRSTLTGDRTRNEDIVSTSVVSTNSMAEGVSINQLATKLNWSEVAKDTYKAVFELNQEAAYEIKLDGYDMAGNKLYGIDTPKFMVDTVNPIIKLEGIKQIAYAAYNNEKITPSISIYDEQGNLDLSSIKITVNGTNSNISTLTNHELFDLTTDSFTTRSDITDGVNYVSQYFNNDIETKDDIYTLHIELKDLAQNAISHDYRFSVNRYGSTYIYDIATAIGANYSDNDTVYIKSILGTPLFTEINCDFLDDKKTELSLTYTNTQNQKQTQIVLEKGKDYDVVASPDNQADEYNIKKYTYQLINAELFEYDGVYQLFVTTFDGATNINRSGEEVGEVATTKQIMRFVVDKNAPRIDAESNFEKFEYTDDDHLTIDDNNKLVSEVFSTDGKKASLSVAIDEKNLDLDAIDKDTISVTFDGKSVEATVDEVNGVYLCSFDLDSTTKGYDLVVSASDKAANSALFTVNKLLVSNNWFVRFVNNKVALGCTIAGVVAAVGAVSALVIIKKRKTKFEEE